VKQNAETKKLAGFICQSVDSSSCCRSHC